MSTPECTLQVRYQWGGRSLTEEAYRSLSLVLQGNLALLSVDAPYAGDPPPAAPPGHLYGLWDFEVVELFIACEARPERYLELEVGPHGHFLALSFEQVRASDARQLSASGAVSYRSEIRGERWSACLIFPHRWLPPKPWRGCAFAIDGVGRERRYFLSSLLPGEMPDFHQPASFPLLSAHSPLK